MENEKIDFVYVGLPYDLYEGGCYDDCEEYGDCSPQCTGE